MWLDPSRSVKSIVWNHHWSTDIIVVLVLDTNPGGTLTNSNIELNVLVLHKATILVEFPEAIMVNPLSGSDNTPTVS